MPEPDRQAYIGLGGNLGDARLTIERALGDLDQVPGIRVLRVSPYYRSAPVQAEGPDFVNAVAELQTGLAPLALLDALQAVELAHHRARPFHHAPRTLDIDLLWYEGETMAHERLTLPHPRMHERAFVLAPLQDLRPDWDLPQGDLASLLAACGDQPISRLD